MADLRDQQLVLHPLAPVLLGLRARLRPRRVLALDAVRLVRREVPRAVHEQVRREIDALAQAFDVEVVEVVAERDVAAPDLVVQRRLARGEAVEVGLQEDRVVEVVERDEVRPGAARYLVVQRLLQDVVLRQHAPEPLGDAPVVVARLDGLRGRPFLQGPDRIPLIVGGGGPCDPVTVSRSRGLFIEGGGFSRPDGQGQPQPQGSLHA